MTTTLLHCCTNYERATSKRRIAREFRVQIPHLLEPEQIHFKDLATKESQTERTPVGRHIPSLCSHFAMMFTRLVPCPAIREISQHCQELDTSITQVLDSQTSSGPSIVSMANLEYDPARRTNSNQDILQFNEHEESKLSRPYGLNSVGVREGANDHVMFSWLVQDFCVRAGPRSRASIWSLRDGGLDSALQAENGEADVIVATPVGLMRTIIEVDALLQEAIMKPWWRGLINANKVVPQPAEQEASPKLQQKLGLKVDSLPKRIWESLTEDLPALDFSDFRPFVREDLHKEVGYVLARCLVETWHMLEALYRHFPSAQSPATYPLEPSKMCQTSGACIQEHISITHRLAFREMHSLSRGGYN